MPTEIAYFTSKVKSGTAKWIDFWNADLYDGESHLERLHTQDKIQFRGKRYTYLDEIDAGYGNGVIQAIFGVPTSDYYLIIAKLSSVKSIVNIAVDDNIIGMHWIEETGQEIPVMVHLPAGQHTMNVIQLSKIAFFTIETNPLWFHSITVFQV